MPTMIQVVSPNAAMMMIIYDNDDVDSFCPETALRLQLSCTSLHSKVPPSVVDRTARAMQN